MLLLIETKQSFGSANGFTWVEAGLSLQHCTHGMEPAEELAMVSSSEESHTLHLYMLTGRHFLLWYVESSYRKNWKGSVTTRESLGLIGNTQD